MEAKVEEALNLSYDDFEPFCKWTREEGHVKLEVHVQDFKMEHMSVQIQEPGVVTITGERPLDDTRRSRFRKQIRIPKDSKTDEIQANLYGDILHVVVPRKIPALPATKSCTKTSTITASMPSNYLFGLIQSAISRLEMNTMLALPVAGVLAMVVAFVGYAYKYCYCGDAES
ncbi:hypothetical protein POTOM_059071 [Populus tomentosa]|uniref:SHSP domain-containing protein n=1 Tax=Populus tomentosa TaxID=118781 RepID=A0A8X7XNY9_POPTO|nr:hypothetical protein POTOM_059071 [Populus tomentosa]